MRATQSVFLPFAFMNTFYLGKTKHRRSRADKADVAGLDTKMIGYITVISIDRFRIIIVASVSAVLSNAFDRQQ